MSESDPCPTSITRTRDYVFLHVCDPLNLVRHTYSIDKMNGWRNT